MDTVAPTKFGKYDVVGVLGKGAMGTVYDCRDPVIGRRVAIKTVSKEAFDRSESEALLGRFKQEAQAAGRLNHPGVVSIYDYGETEDVAFIAMEYISGKELKQYFDAGEKFDLKQIVRIMCEILDALDHAHRNKVVHRDIKPANIMITDDGRVKVADFGVAKIESALMTQVGTRVGTPAYMSPEQHKMLSVDGRSDLFSCGVILYQFLTGSRPFTGGSHTIAQQILTQTPIPPSEVNVALPAIWDSIVRKALAKRRDERFLTARDFIEALRHGLNTSPSAIDGLATSFSDGPHDTASRSSRESSAEASRGGNVTGGGKNERTDVHMESELEFWKEIKDSDVAEDFAAFVESFPEGRFSHLAKRRLEKLRQATDRIQQEETALPTGRTSAPPAQKRGEVVADPTKVAPAAKVDQEAELESRRAAQERAERESKQRLREEAEARARQAAEGRAEREAKERAEREAKERAEREAKERAEREAKERAEREAKERARKEAEARKQEALQKEAARVAAEKALKEQQEKARREAEIQRQREQEAKARLAEAERKRVEDQKRQREAEQQALANAKAARDAALLADPDATQIRHAAGAKAPGVSAPIDDPDATMIRADAASIRDVDATFIQYRGDPAKPEAKPQASTGATARQAENRKQSRDVGGQGMPTSADVDIDLSDDGSSSAAAPATAKGVNPAVAPDAKAKTRPVTAPLAQPPAPAPVAAPSASTAGRARVSVVDQPEAEPETRSRSIQVMAGLAVVLAAAGAGWVYFSSGPAPSPVVADKSVSESRTAETGASAPTPPPRKDAAPKAADKAAPPGPDASKVADAQKAEEAAEKGKLELETQNRAAEKAAADKAAADKSVAAKAVADKVAAKSAADKQAAEKAAAKAIADKAATEKLAAEKAAADRRAAENAAAEKAAADKAAAEKVAAAKAASDKAAAEKAASEKAAADKAAADRVASAGSIADRIAAASSPPELYKRAVALRSEGKVSQAVALLRQASSQGHGPSSRLLVTIFTEGASDVRANFREVERYKAIAETQGER